MSESGLLLEFGCLHCRGQCESFIIGASDQACLHFSIMTLILLEWLSPSATGVPHRYCHQFLLVIVFMYEWF